MSSKYSTPILFLIFNRPDTTEKVFQRIREVQPVHLYISADGPRLNRPAEIQNCRQARRIIEKIDWDCDLHTHFSETNLGCRMGVSSGIDWFFSQVPEGIILEDDCLPEISFFHFCETLLAHYRENPRVMQIGGANYREHSDTRHGSYYFSRLTQIWGWATWKRAWALYDVDIKTYGTALNQHVPLNFFPNPSMRRFWKKKFDMAYRHQIDTWDIQWQFTMSLHDGLAALPRVNLVSNIGFNENATHTTDNFHTLANRKTSPLDTLIHPPTVAPDARMDTYVFRKFINPNKIKKLWILIRRMLTR